MHGHYSNTTYLEKNGLGTDAFNYVDKVTSWLNYTPFPSGGERSLLLAGPVLWAREAGSGR